MDSDITVKVKQGDIIKESSHRVTLTYFINIIDLEMLWRQLRMKMQQPVAPPNNATFSVFSAVIFCRFIAQTHIAYDRNFHHHWRRKRIVLD